MLVINTLLMMCLDINPDRPRNCEEIRLLGGKPSGVYRIYPFYPQLKPTMEQNGTEVYCDQLTEGGGWTVIQRRYEREPLTTKENFERVWTEYAAGFGNPSESYWIGLDSISELTKRGDVQLRIEMTDWEGESRVVEYGYFRVTNATDLYRLYLTEYSGNAGDSMSDANGAPFTTKDKDNDSWDRNCAQNFNGAWWYNACHKSNLNGLYIHENNGNHTSYANGINWYTWHGHHNSLKRTEMKIRTRNFVRES